MILAFVIQVIDSDASTVFITLFLLPPIQNCTVTAIVETPAPGRHQWKLLKYKHKEYFTGALSLADLERISYTVVRLSLSAVLAPTSMIDIM